MRFALVTLLVAIPCGRPECLGQMPQGRAGANLAGKVKRAPGKSPDEKRESAIRRGLEFLAQQQQKSGAWRIKVYGESTAATSLAVMAFLAAKHKPGRGPYGPHIERGIDWVIDQRQRVDRRPGKETVLLAGGNRSHGPMYSHGISTWMLASVLKKLKGDRAKRARDALTKATRLIIAAQNVPKPVRHKGGWRYLPDSRDSDLCVTAWQVLALHASKTAGCDVPQKNFDRAIAYVKKCATRGGGFAYQPGGRPSTTRSGIGIFVLETCGKHESKEALAAAEYLLTKPLRRTTPYNSYGVFPCTVGMFKLGGKYWESQDKATQKLLLPSQSKQGSWSGRSPERRYGESYCTALAVLALTVE